MTSLPQPPQPQPPSPEPHVQPQPTPFQPFVGRGTLANGQPVVVLQVLMVTGTVMLFIPPDDAVKFGNDLIANGRGAASGLVLPPGVQLGSPPPHTANGHADRPTQGEKEA